MSKSATRSLALRSKRRSSITQAVGLRACSISHYRLTHRSVDLACGSVTNWSKRTSLRNSGHGKSTKPFCERNAILVYWNGPVETSSKLASFRSNPTARNESKSFTLKCYQCEAIVISIRMGCKVKCCKRFLCASCRSTFRSILSCRLNRLIALRIRSGINKRLMQPRLSSTPSITHPHATLKSVAKSTRTKTMWLSSRTDAAKTVTFWFS